MEEPNYQEIFKRTKDAWSLNYKKAEDDLFFLSDDDYAQWDAQDYNNRVKTGRPVITIDQLGQFVNQVVNDIRQNTPTINVYPSDKESSKATAEVYKGLIREIEYYSRADQVYDTAANYSVRCGIGFIRVENIPDRQEGLQRLCIKRVVNPLSVWIDPDSIECDGSDANFAFVLEEVSQDEFKRRYPKANPVDFEEPQSKKQDYITIAEYFEKDGDIVTRRMLSGDAVLDETVFPSKYIPIIPVYGQEYWAKGRRHIVSLIRPAKGAQRMYNYWKSLETELLQKAPKAPVMAATGQVEDFKDDWTNPDKTAVLRYNFNDAQGNPVGPPQRLEPPTIPTGVVNASRSAVDDIKSTLGLYNASLGQVSNETSGIAIRERQREGDVSTFHFADNLSRSIEHVGRLLVDAIPRIYDTPRVLSIIGLEEDVNFVGVNGALAINQIESVNLMEGQYDVRVSTGASYTTRRQEAAQFLAQMVNSNPEMIKIVGDLLFKNMDFTGAEAMSERIKKIMLPEVFDENENPQIAVLNQQIQQAQATISALQAELGNKQTEFGLKAQAEQNDSQEAVMKMQLELRKLEIDQQRNAAEVEIKVRELALREQELALKQAELQAEVALHQQGVNYNNALLNREV